MLLNAKDSCLLLIDVQEKLTPFIHEAEKIIKNCAWMMRLAQRLHVPVLVSEQYVKGLGPTIKELKELAPVENFMEKVHFSCAADATCLAKINLAEKNQVVLIGIESHVCVFQTAVGLHEAGKKIFVIYDAVSSRDPQDKKIAMKRLRHLGIQVISKEMAFFEWVHQAGTPEFKQLSQEFLK
jgi:nicotinamidase-related amidase